MRPDRESNPLRFGARDEAPTNYPASQGHGLLFAGSDHSRRVLDVPCHLSRPGARALSWTLPFAARPVSSPSLVALGAAPTHSRKAKCWPGALTVPKRGHTISRVAKSRLRAALVRLSRIAGWSVKILEKFWSRILKCW